MVRLVFMSLKLSELLCLFLCGQDVFKQCCFTRAFSLQASGIRQSPLPAPAFLLLTQPGLEEGGGARRDFQPTVVDKLRSVAHSERCGRAPSQRSVRGGIKTTWIALCLHACDERFPRALLRVSASAGTASIPRWVCVFFEGVGGEEVKRSWEF